MALSSRKLMQKRLEAARAYLVLGMPKHALQELSRIEHVERCRFDFNLLRGEAYRDLDEHLDSVSSFAIARQERPENLQVLLGIAWCQKRLDLLPAAIETLEEARRYHPDEAIVIYNLACYYSLAGNKSRALEYLGRSLRMDPELHRLIADEHDFDPLRDDPDFQFVTESVGQHD